MNGLPYYKAYPRDFFDGTVGMDFELKAAYRLVLDLIYMHGGHLADDPRFIAGHLGCSVKKWNSLRAALLDAGKLTVSRGYLGNYRADKELEILKSYQGKQRENRAGSKKNKTLAETTVKPNDNHTESESEPYKEEEDARGDFSDFENQPEPPPAEPPECEPGFLEDIRHAVGIQPHSAGAYWADAALTAHVAAWRSYGLSDDQIIAEAKASRTRNPDPPDGPKALDRWMQAAAKAKRNAPAHGRGAQSKPDQKPATMEDQMKFYADWINGPRPCPPSAISSAMAKALLNAGLVTPSRLRERQIAA